MFYFWFDCKHINNGFSEILKGVKFVRCGCRLAFDRIEEDGVFQEAVLNLLKIGIAKSSIMSYVLFNFKDTPQEANYRMTECVKLGIRPYPQQYTPLNKSDRNDLYIGKHRTKRPLRTFRYLWLMARLHTKMTFEDYIDERYIKAKDNLRLKDEDWAAWKKK